MLYHHILDYQPSCRCDVHYTAVTESFTEHMFYYPVQIKRKLCVR
jgi:hypothetical protein